MVLALRTVVFCVLLMCLLSVAYCETIVLKDGLNGYAGTRDSYIDKDNPNVNYGTGYYMQLYMSSYSPKRSGLIKFDITGQIPSNSIINSATLSLYLCEKVNMASGDFVYVAPFRIGNYRNWVETEATWNVYRGSSYWSVAGCEGYQYGDRNQNPDCNAIYFDKDSPLGYYHWDVTSSVQAWYSGSATNNGWLMRITAHDGGTDGVNFYTREYSPSWRPYLTINYTVIPEPASLSAIAFGLAGLVSIVRRKSK